MSNQDKHTNDIENPPPQTFHHGEEAPPIQLTEQPNIHEPPEAHSPSHPPQSHPQQQPSNPPYPPTYAHMQVPPGQMGYPQYPYAPPYAHQPFDQQYRQQPYSATPNPFGYVPQPAPQPPPSSYYPSYYNYYNGGIDDTEKPINQPLHVRRKFFLKVYLIVLMQLLITAGLTFMNIFVPGLREWNMRHYWVILVLFITSIVVMCFFTCFERVFPVNYILFGLWTLLIAYGIAMITSLYDLWVILWVVLICAVVVIALTVFVFITKARFGNWFLISLYVGVMILFFVGISSPIIFLVIGIGRWWYFIFALLGSLIFCGFLLYDTSRILHRHSVNHPLSAAMSLYMDIVFLFVLLLSCFGAGRSTS